MDLSSDNNDCVLQNNNIESECKLPERPRTPDPHCSICLGVLSNKCYSNSCLHLFCFECLKQWATINPTCPLCKTHFQTIFHTFNDQGSFETYEVPIPVREFPSSQRIVSLLYGQLNENLLPSFPGNNRFNDHIRNHRLYTINPPEHFGIARTYDILPTHSWRHVVDGNAVRIRVYRHNMWAEPLLGTIGRYASRESSPDYYRVYPTVVHRLRGFIFRDINAIRALITNLEHTSRFRSDELTNVVADTVFHLGIRDAAMIDLLRPYLQDYADHFCHELYNFAISPYDMVAYDHYVQYSINAIQIVRSRSTPPEQTATDSPRPAAMPLPEIYDNNEIIVVDSESDVEEIVETSTSQVNTINNVVPSPSTETDDNDSEIEILAHPIRPSVQFNCNSSFRDQPSTSTGIQDSIDQPNNRYNLRRRKTNSSGLRSGESVNILSSSSDDELANIDFVWENCQSIHAETETVHGRMKRKVKKSKVKKSKVKKSKVKKSKVKKSKVKKNDDSSESSFCSTNHSYSDSWSSSDESDARPQNCHTCLQPCT